MITFILIAGCVKKPASQDVTNTKGSDNNEHTSTTNRRISVYNEVYEKSIPVFKKIIAAANRNLSLNNSLVEKNAALIAKRSKIMLENLARGENFIHPIAFFAMIKDFESFQDYRWSTKNSLNAGMTTRNCYNNGECFGMFQVDVNIERNPRWYKESCGSQYLNISSETGGMDFCSLMFWFTTATNGRKCGLVSPKKGNNICKNVGDTWELKDIERARSKAYVQALQHRRGWTKGHSWSTNYCYYSNIAISKESGKKRNGGECKFTFAEKEHLRASVNKFFNAIGLGTQQEFIDDNMYIALADETDDKVSILVSTPKNQQSVQLCLGSKQDCSSGFVNKVSLSFAFDNENKSIYRTETPIQLNNNNTIVTILRSDSNNNFDSNSFKLNAI